MTRAGEHDVPVLMCALVATRRAWPAVRRAQSTTRPFPPATGHFVRPGARQYLESVLPREPLEQVERADRLCRGAGVCVEATK